MAPRTLARFGLAQLKNLARVARGEPMTFPSFASMTLDADDLALAAAWLARPDDWYRPDEVERYHAAFAAWNGSAHAFSFMSGRVALSAILHALGLQPGDEVILPGYTCVVVPNALRYAGLTPVYSDIELESYGLDGAQIEEKIGPRTRAILIQHLYGLVCRDYEAIVALARRHELFVIEDCAHSTGASLRGRKVGNLGDAAFYSSEQSKVWNTIQGGMATTHDAALAARLRSYHEQAPYPDQAWLVRHLAMVRLAHARYKHPQRWWRGDWAEARAGMAPLLSTTAEEEQGIRPAHYGRKLPAPIAALGLNQLGKVDRHNQQRRATAARWAAWCQEQGYAQPLVLPDSIPVFLRYPVLVEPQKKQHPAWARRALGVRLGVWFTSHTHPTPCPPLESCPNAAQAVARCINLPTLL